MTTITLWHGTSEAFALNALRVGLKPRGRKPSRWPDCPSAPDSVYLTDAYPLHFAANCAGERQRYGICEVEVESTNLLADEDVLEQAGRRYDTESPSPNVPPGDARKRAIAYRKLRYNAAKVRLDGEWSLRLMGTCAYPGPLTVRRVLLVKPGGEIAMRSDPTICLANYRYMGPKYRTLTRFIAGLDPLPEDAEIIHAEEEGCRQLGRDPAPLTPELRMAEVEEVWA